MTTRTKPQIERFLSDNMHRFDVPQQFLGDEPNSYRKDWDEAEVRYLIFASWPYEQAAGNQSIPLVYRTLNASRDYVLADRSYFPSTPRDMKLLTKNGIPTFGIEQRRQMKDYDIIGTSLSYPVLNINFIYQLHISGVPVRWQERQKNPEKWPFVMLGGTSYGAPEVTANVTDCHFVGEVEDEPNNPGIAAVMDAIRHQKTEGLWETDREECYRQLAREFNFLYFPRFIDIHYKYDDNPQRLEEKGLKHPQKVVTGYSSNLDGMRLPIKKRFVKDMDAVEGLTDPPLLFQDPGMGAGDLEVARGCPAWCSFCKLTYAQKPYRQRSVDTMVTMGQQLLNNTGGTHVAPFSPDFPMHTQKKKLVNALLTEVTDDVDASSMRVDDFIADPEYILLQVHGGMDQVTLGVEGNSQRMRDLVGKGCSDKDVKEAVARGIQAGLRRFKLYMICDLPGEDKGDILSILRLARELAEIRDSMGRHKVKIQFSWTPLLVESLTPFQWFAPTEPNRVLSEVWDEFREYKIDFKLGSKAEKNKQAYFQSCQRSSRDVGDALIDAVIHFDKGCWGGVSAGMKEKIDECLVKKGFLNGIADIFDTRDRLDMFGWEWLDLGINEELLWKTYVNMKTFLEGTDSMTYDLQIRDHIVTRGDGKTYHGNEWIPRCDVQCQHGECGACDPEDLRIRHRYKQDAKGEEDVDLINVRPKDERTVIMRARCKVWKDESHRHVMNDHWRFAVRRAAFRTGAPIAKRTVRFSSDAIKFKDYTCGADFVEIGLTKRLDRTQLKVMVEAMNEELSFIKITDVSSYPSTADELRSDVDLSLYEMEVDLDHDSAINKINAFRSADYVKMVLKEELRMSGTVREEVNAKDFVPDLWLVRNGHRLNLRMLVRGKANPYVVYAALTGRASWIEASKHPAVRLDAFIEMDATATDFFRPDCESCDGPIPINLMDKPYDHSLCPRCKDESEGTTVGELTNA